MQKFKPTIEEIEEKLPFFAEEWDKILGISPEWNVYSQIRPVKDFKDDEEVLANVKWPAWYRSARIRWNKKMLLNRERISCWCKIEAAYAHELVHLVLADITNRIDDSVSGTANTILTNDLETLVDKLTNRFMILRYGTGKSMFCNGE